LSGYPRPNGTGFPAIRHQPCRCSSSISLSCCLSWTRQKIGWSKLYQIVEQLTRHSSLRWTTPRRCGIHPSQRSSRRTCFHTSAAFQMLRSCSRCEEPSHLPAPNGIECLQSKRACWRPLATHLDISLVSVDGQASRGSQLCGACSGARCVGGTHTGRVRAVGAPAHLEERAYIATQSRGQPTEQNQYLDSVLNPELTDGKEFLFNLSFSSRAC
jgi:hypothetical protein